MLRASMAASRGNFQRAVQLIDEAIEIMPLLFIRVRRAMILLQAERTRDAYQAFDELRQQLKGSQDPDHRYLCHFCTAMLSLMQPGSGQWAYESKQAKAIKCSRGIKFSFPLVTVDEIDDRIKPRR